MSYHIHLLESQQSFEAAAGETVLDGALRANVQMAHDCRFGGCATCRVRLVEGAVAYDEYPMGLTPEEEAEGFALACQARPTSDLVISTARPGEPCAEPARHTAVIRNIAPLSADVVHLTLELPQAETLDYRPGQYLKIFTGDGIARSFSMASVPRDRTVDLHVRRIPGGYFTERLLASLRSDDRLDVELPLGGFYFRKDDYRPLVMVATGTGLAPIKSILESLMDDPDCPPVSLYWGMRTAADLYMHEQIQAWGARLYDFQYVPVLSRADEAWSGRRGHVQHAVAADLPDLSEHAIYLCGSPDMIRDARETFLALGASGAHIYADSFTFQRS